MAIHVGIIDKDPVRLITALLHREFNADKMIFIGINSQYSQFEQLNKVAVSKGIDTEFFPISTNDITQTKKEINQLASRLNQTNKEIYLNASCGLRHHLLATYEIFRSYRWQIYVIDFFSDELHWLYPENRKTEQIEDRLTVEDCLTIFGARCEIEAKSFYHDIEYCIPSLGKKWASNAQELTPGLATLNYLATFCKKSQSLEVELSEKQQGYKELHILIDDLVSANLAQYQDGTLIFANDATRRFANGEWLECYVHYLVDQIHQELPTIQDVNINIQVHRQIGNQEIRNEIDVACIVNNKLHIIECKTKSMDSDGDETLYKLESIRELLGGLQGRALLVSFRPLKSYDKHRAEELGLALIGPEQLGELKEYLYQWFIDAKGYNQSF